MFRDWYIINSCYLESSRHITTPVTFAASCIGVIPVTVTLELLRRAAKEFDRYLVRKYASTLMAYPTKRSSEDSDDKTRLASPTPTHQNLLQVNIFRPIVLGQLTRALLHTVQFAVIYFIMFLAMYFDSYIILSIFIGVFIGALIFHWEPLKWYDKCE
ncbi:Tctr2 protein [Daldinia eschscholtzii]|nr:Tctr2 protein [Daldinia eschscholtzii]